MSGYCKRCGEVMCICDRINETLAKKNAHDELFKELADFVAWLNSVDETIGTGLTTHEISGRARVLLDKLKAAGLDVRTDGTGETGMKNAKEKFRCADCYWFKYPLSTRALNSELAIAGWLRLAGIQSPCFRNPKARCTTKSFHPMSLDGKRLPLCLFFMDAQGTLPHDTACHTNSG